MKTTEQVLSELVRQKPALGERFKIRSMGLFGSYARGDQTEDSDVDILVDVDPAISRSMWRTKPRHLFRLPGPL